MPERVTKQTLLSKVAMSTTAPLVTSPLPKDHRTHHAVNLLPVGGNEGLDSGIGVLVIFFINENTGALDTCHLIG